jgi:sugar phosphate isomerase/epimerase
MAKVEVYKTLWGLGGTMEQRLERVKSQGYEGFEDWVQPHFTLKPIIDKVGLKYMAMVAGDEVEAFKRGLGEAYDNGAVGATIHAGRPWMTYQQGLDHLGKLVEATKQVPFPVNFETHRGRLLFEPMSTAQYLKDLPDLYLCADLSHWTVVTESMLGGFGSQIELVLSRTRHIHARIGFEEGPQVPDPREKNWEGYTPTFEKWWDIVHANNQKAGRLTTFDPEFGPPHYQWTNPQTGAPLADIEDVAMWMTKRLRDRWSK